MNAFFRWARSVAPMSPFTFLACSLLAGVGCARHAPSEDDLGHKDSGASSPGADVSTAPPGPTPTPARVNYRSVWGSGHDDVWAVGDKGTIVHFDGMGWSASPSGTTTENLTSVHGTSPTDVWVSGDKGTIYRWDGKAWTRASEIADTALLSVWASGTNDIWAVGTLGGGEA